jgi:FKBP12-rapamycin complex-associated protein
LFSKVLFVDAERSCCTHLVPSVPPLNRYCLQALGVALEEQLHLLLPALMRLVAASGGGTPLEIKRAVLRSMKKLLPRMHLAGFSSAVLQPLMKVCCVDDSFSCVLLA